jgi:hypothetical protein
MWCRASAVCFCCSYNKTQQCYVRSVHAERLAVHVTTHQIIDQHSVLISRDSDNNVSEVPETRAHYCHGLCALCVPVDLMRKRCVNLLVYYLPHLKLPSRMHEAYQRIPLSSGLHRQILRYARWAPSIEWDKRYVFPRPADLKIPTLAIVGCAGQYSRFVLGHLKAMRLVHLVFVVAHVMHVVRVGI